MAVLPSSPRIRSRSRRSGSPVFFPRVSLLWYRYYFRWHTGSYPVCVQCCVMHTSDIYVSPSYSLTSHFHCQPARLPGKKTKHHITHHRPCADQDCTQEHDHGHAVFPGIMVQVTFNFPFCQRKFPLQRCEKQGAVQDKKQSGKGLSLPHLRELYCTGKEKYRFRHQ